jgi:hypothetical protein
LQSLGPPSCQDLLLLHRHGTLVQQGLAAQLLRPHLVPALSYFLSALYLDDPANWVQQADGRLRATLFDFDRLPLNAIEFSCYLYRRLLNDPSLPAPPAALPAVLPAWLGALGPAERRFLDCCVQHLALPDRLRVYLSFYANLSTREIHRIQQGGHFQPRQAVITQLRESYRLVVRKF